MSFEGRTLSAAQVYLTRGWRCVPLRPRDKKPIGEGWQARRLDLADLPREFFGDRNIGLLLGDPSAGLADVDIDCDEALALAPAFLPATAAIFGRESKPQSHWLYQVEPTDFRTTQFRDPTVRESDETNMLLELRGTGGQSMCPPSLHPCGENVEWASNGNPTGIEFEKLKCSVAKIAAGALLVRYWSRGNRHVAALALAGSLLRSGWTEEEAERFVYEVANAAHDEEANARRADVRSTVQKLAAGGPATGQRTCIEIFNEGVWQRVREWLDLKCPSESMDAAGPYRETDSGLVRVEVKGSPERQVEIPHALTNFTARIVADVSRDDGAESARAFEIEAHLSERSHTFIVPASHSVECDG
jgi:putative DNA primase/helicase